ncbi:hypothetical protein FDA94_28515 [Herbidospora galbida]|uniref:Uncharacterized protein n=1 Tax=Herbidospora galbida TaxID=2575442 RepID=A0A4U3M6M5_9ACTN|nr:hypothetical protein [Herbidospora galbida]TKK84575.1 hypothetical protein FDA94_28515 [Herbidospora galbida]
MIDFLLNLFNRRLPVTANHAQRDQTRRRAYTRFRNWPGTLLADAVDGAFGAAWKAYDRYQADGSPLMLDELNVQLSTLQGLVDVLNVKSAEPSPDGDRA